MRYTAEILRLQKDPHYEQAVDVLQSILHGKAPAQQSLAQLYGRAIGDTVWKDISEFLHTNQVGTSSPRKHVHTAPTEISDKRHGTEMSDVFRQTHSKLLLWEVPGSDQLNQFYGEFSEPVGRVLDLTLKAGLKRRCGLPVAAHLNRVAAVVAALKMDLPGKHTYVSIAAMHDAIEDLLHLYAHNKDARDGLAGYHNFVESLIPLRLQPHVKLLTNHYDLVLKSVELGLRRADKAMTKKNLLQSIEELTRAEVPDITDYSARLREFLEDAPIEHNTLENAKWTCYRDLYIHQMAIEAKKASDFRTFQIKACDLSDNAHGRDALPMSGRIKNIIKMGIWAREGYALQSSWAPLNNHVMELQEDALVHAEHLIIRDFLEPISVQDFALSALLKIRDLQSVLFVDQIRREEGQHGQGEAVPPG